MHARSHTQSITYTWIRTQTSTTRQKASNRFSLSTTNPFMDKKQPGPGLVWNKLHLHTDHDELVRVGGGGQAVSQTVYLLLPL